MGAPTLWDESFRLGRLVDQCRQRETLELHSTVEEAREFFREKRERGAQATSDFSRQTKRQFEAFGAAMLALMERGEG